MKQIIAKTVGETVPDNAIYLYSCSAKETMYGEGKIYHYFLIDQE